MNYIKATSEDLLFHHLEMEKKEDAMWYLLKFDEFDEETAYKYMEVTHLVRTVWEFSMDFDKSVEALETLRGL